jgi:hypothetical protein
MQVLLERHKEPGLFRRLLAAHKSFVIQGRKRLLKINNQLVDLPWAIIDASLPWNGFGTQRVDLDAWAWR